MRRVFSGNLFICREFVRINDIKIEDRIFLKKATREGCSKSLAAIYTKYQPAICDFLRKIGADESSEDICQAVFLEILERRCKYDGSSTPKTFLFGIASNLYKNGFRANKKVALETFPDQVRLDSIAQDCSKTCPLEKLQTAECGQFIVEAIGKLPKKAAQAIKMVYHDGIPAVKAAKLVGCSFPTFRKRIEMGLRQFKENVKNLEL